MNVYTNKLFLFQWPYCVCSSPNVENRSLSLKDDFWCKNSKIRDINNFVFETFLGKDSFLEDKNAKHPRPKDGPSNDKSYRNNLAVQKI